VPEDAGSGFDPAADLELAIRAAERAAAAVLPLFGVQLAVEYKSADQPVTEADHAANRAIHEVLVGHRGDSGWLSEETADSGARLGHRRVWLVDPIDGTRSFVEGYAEYAISIALAVDGRACVGVVLNPSTGELYHAVHGQGAFRGGQRIRVGADDLERRVLLASRSELARGEFDPLRETWRIQPLGSTAYKMVKVADGTGTAYLSRGPKSEWDVAAAALIVAEAGGTVTDLSGMQLRFNRPSPFLHGIVAAEARLHDELLRHVATLASVPRGRTGEER
jgi:myo-inositol-1(or 4)-monophosphatase